MLDRSLPTSQSNPLRLHLWTKRESTWDLIICNRPSSTSNCFTTRILMTACRDPCNIRWCQRPTPITYIFQAPRIYFCKISTNKEESSMIYHDLRTDIARVKRISFATPPRWMLRRQLRLLDQYQPQRCHSISAWRRREVQKGKSNSEQKPFNIA